MEEHTGNINNNINGDHLRAMAAETPAPIGAQYTVEERDTIPEIERKCGFPWQEILEANKDLLTDESSLQPGMRLKIPSK